MCFVWEAVKQGCCSYCVLRVCWLNVKMSGMVCGLLWIIWLYEKERSEDGVVYMLYFLNFSFFLPPSRSGWLDVCVCDVMEGKWVWWKGDEGWRWLCCMWSVLECEGGGISEERWNKTIRCVVGRGICVCVCFDKRV